ncbi:hypothetical protein PYCC9005_001284 [Savitreella phatthalungensis]
MGATLKHAGKVIKLDGPKYTTNNPMKLIPETVPYDTDEDTDDNFSIQDETSDSSYDSDTESEGSLPETNMAHVRQITVRTADSSAEHQYTLASDYQEDGPYKFVAHSLAGKDFTLLNDSGKEEKAEVYVLQSSGNGNQE